jgi:hypothetical protein
MAQIDIANENLQRLIRIQEVIQIEDEVDSNLDETLSRVLNFYGRFVSYHLFEEQ